MIRPFIIDVHGHIGPAKGFRARHFSTDDIVRLMDATWVEVMIFVSMSLLSQQYGLGYSETLRALDRHPRRLRAYTVFDPAWPDVSMRLLRQYQDHPGIVGIKIHPSVHGAPPEDTRYAEMWDYADSRKLPVLTHTWAPDPANPSQNYATPDRFDQILEAHPGARLILGHCGGRMEGHRLAAEMLKKHPNCWADISGDTHSLGLLEWLAREAGVGKILYGTDVNWIEPRYHLGKVLKAGLPPEDKLRILRTNALDVFGDKLISTESGV
ncbi:MAG: amidohydrolase family protein [bacterium]|nr:amidohydrolase family protein [Candidatus Sumerlaeota bacterium]